MMAKAKTPEQPRQTPKFVVLLAWLMFGPPRGATWTLLVLLGFAAFAFGLWRHVQPIVVSSPEYQITARNVDITPLPQWIRSDVAAQALAGITLDTPLSVLDDQLTQRVNDAFSAHPWVAKVERVTKRHPARVQVDLIYRRPVCMVEVAAGMLPGGGLAPSRLLPVDVKGVLLPEDDFSEAERERYPRLSGVSTAPLAGPGAKWGDARVHGGAEVAAALVEVWSELSLERIVASPSPEQGPTGDEHTFEVFTTGGTRILWGYSPSTRRPGQVAAVDKVARLRKLLEGANDPLQIDVRHWHQARVLARPQRTATAPGDTRVE